jgi:hypothetical protein
MQYGEIIAVCSEIHTKHINTLCGQNAELLHDESGDTSLCGNQLGRVFQNVRWCASKWN